MSFGPGFPNKRDFDLGELAAIGNLLLNSGRWAYSNRQKVSQILEFKGQKIGVSAMGIATIIFSSWAFFNGSIQVLEVVFVFMFITGVGGIIILFTSWGLIYRSMRRYRRNQADRYTAF